MAFRNSQMLIFSIGLAMNASAGIACSLPTPDFKPPSLTVQARQHIAQADAIVDGEIVRISGWDYKNKREIPALLRVTRILKGPKLTAFSLRLPGGGCEIFFWRKERVRLLLSESKGSWAALHILNLPSPVFSGSPDTRSIDNRIPYARLIDKQIGLPRSADTVITLDGY